MLIRWVHLATFVVVVSLNAVSCDSDNTHTDINVDNIDVFCPCLQRQICPRVFGTKPEDSKYLGDLMQCEDNDLVRCCGASDSYVVGILRIISTTQVPEPDIFSKLNPEDDVENEIPDPGREYDKFTTMPSIDEIADSENVQDVYDLDEKLTIDGRIDQEPAESKSVTETLRTEAPVSHDFKSVDTVIADNFDEKLRMEELTVEEPDKSESTTETTEASETETPISLDFETVDDSEANQKIEAPIIHDLKSLDGSEITEASINHDFSSDASGITKMPTIEDFKSLDGSEVTETPTSHDIKSDDSEITENSISDDLKSVDDSEITETEAPIIQEVKSLDVSEITATTETQAPDIHGFNSLGGEITEIEAPIDDDFKSLHGSEITTTTETEAPIIQGFNPLDDSETTEISQTETPIYNEFESLENSEITEASVTHDLNLQERGEITATTETESPIIHEFISLDGSETKDISGTEAPTDFDFKSLENIADGNEAITLEPNVLTTESPIEDLAISYRKPKMLNNIIMVYPNEMSGIPKTTPKNMPETNELKMFDEDMGMDLHLVFSKSTSEPNIDLESTTATSAVNQNIELETTTVAEKSNINLETTTLPDNDSTTTKQLQLQFGDRKRRRQYRPTRNRTTASPTKVTRIKSTTSSTPTTPTNLSNRFSSFHKRRLSPQESTDSKIGAKSSTTRITTKTPTTQEEEEILHTSDDDRAHQSRFKLFKPRNRMNYLRRRTTTTTATTTTTELPIAEATHHVSYSVKLNGKKKGENKMDETLIHQIDSSHRTMITKVRDGLMAASTKRPIIAIPRSFGSVDMDKRVRKVETMLASKMMNAYNEIKSDLHRNYEHTTTEQTMEKSTVNTNRPYRGRKKFDLTDPHQYKEIAIKQQRRRMRSTTITPGNLNEDVTTTTRSRRRRPTTVMPSANKQIFENRSTQIIDSTDPKDDQKKHFRRRVKIKRRRLSAEPIITTLHPPLLTTTPTATTITETTNTIKVTDATPTESSKVTDTSHSSDQSKYKIRKTVQIDAESTNNIDSDSDSDAEKLSSNAPFKFKASPLWSIQTDEANDFNQSEDANGKNGRHSRNIFQPPTHYINGFVPVSSIDLDFPIIGPVSSIERTLPIIGPIPKPNKFADDTKVRYSLPTDVQVTNFT